MPAGHVIDGRAIAGEIHRKPPGAWRGSRRADSSRAWSFIRVGEDPASRVYVGMKEKASAPLGIASQTHVLPAHDQRGGTAGIDRAPERRPGRSRHSGAGAAAPADVRSRGFTARSTPNKDVDGFHPVNVGKLLLGDPTGFRSCTPAGIHELLIRSGVRIAGRGGGDSGPGEHRGQADGGACCSRKQRMPAPP